MFATLQQDVLLMLSTTESLIVSNNNEYLWAFMSLDVSIELFRFLAWSDEHER